VRVRQDDALRNRIGVTTAQAEGEPVANRVSDGVAIATGYEAIFVVAKDLPQLALGLSLGPAATALEYPFSTEDGGEAAPGPGWRRDHG